MNEQGIFANSRLRFAITIAILCGLAYLTGMFIARTEVNYRSVIAVLIALGGLFVLTRGERAVQIGFIVFILSLGIGYRTLPAGQFIRIHPSEILLWVLLLILIVGSILRRSRLESSFIPRWLWIMMPFWFWAFIPGYLFGMPWDQMLSEFRNFLLLIPLFFVAVQVLKVPKNWHKVILTIAVLGSWMAVMGNVEYVFPGIRNLLPGYIPSGSAIITDEGFHRAAFAFWGTIDAVFILSLTLPLAIPLWQWSSKSWQKVLVLAYVVLHLTGLYIAGHRDTWVFLLVQIAVWAILEGRVSRTIPLLLILITFIAFVPTLLPEAAILRAQTIIEITSGQTPDSSTLDREQRAQFALNLIGGNPMGNGWASAGWVHSDFLQVIADLGLIPGLLFLAGCLHTAVRLYGSIRNNRLDDEARAVGMFLTLSFVAVVGLLTFETVIVLPQLVLPVWFIWVIAEIWLQQIHSSQHKINESSFALYSTADV